MNISDRIKIEGFEGGTKNCWDYRFLQSVQFVKGFLPFKALPLIITSGSAPCDEKPTMYYYPGSSASGCPESQQTKYTGIAPLPSKTSNARNTNSSIITKSLPFDPDLDRMTTNKSRQTVYCSQPSILVFGLARYFVRGNFRVYVPCIELRLFEVSQLSFGLKIGSVKFSSSFGS
ncbi:uncharacterized protein BDR25DRAFT_353453 [Lindgomyces ingoldianus]|uniref:Uncharacterized protein n=1 Tax=Lindgomyces ingoldianus TaxID=673940 RepID=A0ACB6QZH7_9PLEO|nr:uncharacterized protein BDR25DRAFT_353453 [Lindgomyces ingoldianus]KAF2472428.1 hypothetical protein BDR25DRAFT_353453 [Lindgomyces ingoldianus]